MDSLCPACGEFVDKLDEYTGFCEDCSPAILHQVEHYLAINADHIEHYIIQGYSVRIALRKIAAEVRPFCVVCGKPIKYARRSAVFCSRESICRRYSRRYTYLYQERGYSKAGALAKVLNELEGGQE